MFRLVSDDHQGSVCVPYTITTYQPAYFVVFRFVVVCYLFMSACGVLVGVVSSCVLSSTVHSWTSHQQVHRKQTQTDNIPPQTGIRRSMQADM